MASQGVADPPCFSDRVHPAVKPNVAKVWLNTTPIVRGVSEAFRVVKLRGTAPCPLQSQGFPNKPSPQQPNTQKHRGGHAKGDHVRLVPWLEKNAVAHGRKVV